MQPNTLFFLTAAVLAVAATVHSSPQLPAEAPEIMPVEIPTSSANGSVIFVNDYSSSPTNGSTLAEILNELNMGTR